MFLSVQSKNVGRSRGKAPGGIFRYNDIIVPACRIVKHSARIFTKNLKMEGRLRAVRGEKIFPNPLDKG